MERRGVEEGGRGSRRKEGGEGVERMREERR